MQDPSAAPLAGTPLGICDADPMPPLFFQALPDACRMAVVRQGEVGFYAGTIAYTMHTGDILLLPPQLCHALFPVAGAQLTLLSFPPRRDSVLARDCLLFSVQSQPLVRSLLDLIRAPELLQSARSELLEAILLQLQLSPHIAFRAPDTNSLPLQILAYLNAHFQEELSLNDVSDVFHVSQSHIIHIFNPLFEMSPIQYVIQRRIGEAQHLLLTTNQSAGEIAGAVGIPNRNHFYSTFKRFVGLTPSAYRTHLRPLSASSCARI